MSDELTNISHFIDQILGNYPWTDREINFYKLLKHKVDQYQSGVLSYEFEEDKIDIVKNTMEQPWYQFSKSQTTLNALLKEMVIANYQISEMDNRIETEIFIEFPISKFRLYLFYKLDNIAFYREQIVKGNFKSLTGKSSKYNLQYYLYLEDFDSIKRSYLAYNDTLNTHNLNKDIKLPQLQDLYSIMKLGSYISKMEILKLFTEIILFYDESGLLSITPIGINYPGVSLLYFLNNL